MIGVLFRFQIENQWWKPDGAQRSRRENSAFETGRRAIVQNFLWRSRGITQVVKQIVEKFLNTGRRFERAQRAQLRWRETRTRRIPSRIRIAARKRFQPSRHQFRIGALVHADGLRTASTTCLIASITSSGSWT